MARELLGNVIVESTGEVNAVELDAEITELRPAPAVESVVSIRGLERAFGGRAVLRFVPLDWVRRAGGVALLGLGAWNLYGLVR